MTGGMRAVLVAGLTLLTTPALADGLAVRPGLWESSTSGGASQMTMPQIPPEALARMTPEQQAMMRQRMAGGGAAAPHQYCVTPAMIQRGFAGPNNQHNCTHTVVTATASDVQIDVACNGAHPANGTITIHATGDSSVQGTVDMTMNDGHGGAMPIRSDFQSRWIGPDCGTVRPVE